jgi:neutral ceramidase
MNRREFFQRSVAGGVAARAAFAAEGSGFRAGFAERDITPEIGMEQPGGYGKSYHTSFHDPCKVRAAVFDDGRGVAALVGVDAGAVPRALVEQSRQKIAEHCKIPPHAVLIGASHSHSSGPIEGVMPGEYDHASPLVKKLAYERSTCVDPVYFDRVRTEIVTAVGQAYSSRQPALCAIGKGREDRAAYNRRIRMKNGLTWTHPHPGNPDMVEYAGPIDPEVGVIAAWDAKGRLLGTVVNYACHATTNPGGISANWIYYLEKTIRGAMDSEAPVVFLQGACGDITQVDNFSRYANPAGEDWARLVGARVGAEAIKVLVTQPRGVLAPVDAKSTLLRIPRRKPRPERVRRSLELVGQDPKQVGVTEWTFAKEIVMVDSIIEREPVADVEVQAVQVGPAVFLTNPAELFVQFGLDLKARSPFPFTFPVELANGLVGYVPTEEAFGPHGGGYETRLTSYSNLEIAAGRKMVNAALELAGAMKPGKAPEAPPAQPFREPWSYGNVPPEVD